ncbi:MAG TPA: hypothetical protein ENK38_05205 [Gammaproteobacteria bacterium]|nr:hypothetical protein [Gammaproteobacteria bacterium]
MNHDPLILAYLAGVIDSDGYISIQRSIHNGKYLYHAAKIGIAGTRRQPHDLAASLWGGKVGSYTPKNTKHRPQFQWSRCGSVVWEIITELRPYLRVKREHADLALDLQEHVFDGQSDDPFPWLTPDYDPIPDRERMREKMIRVLNQSRILDGREWNEYPA